MSNNLDLSAFSSIPGYQSVASISHEGQILESQGDLNNSYQAKLFSKIISTSNTLLGKTGWNNAERISITFSDMQIGISYDQDKLVVLKRNI